MQRLSNRYAQSLKLWHQTARASSPPMGSCGAVSLGRGGMSAVAKAMGMSWNTIRVGIRDLQGASDSLPEGRIRRLGGGCKTRAEEQPSLMQAIESLVEPTPCGNPESPLRWACESVRQLASKPRTGSDTTSGRRRWHSCYRLPVTAYRPTARPARARRIQIVMPSSSSSTAV